jgi:hypothetical protein
MPVVHPTEMSSTQIAAKIAAAKEGATVVLPPGRHPIFAAIPLTKSVRLRGADDGSTILDGGNEGAIFQLLGNGNRFGFETLTFQSGAGRQGGAIVSPNRNEVEFEGCRFADNQTTVGGGAGIFYHAKGSFRRCVFERNVSMCGGALGVGKDCDLTLDRCVFIDNRAEAGGAIFLDDTAALEIKNCTFVRNVATEAACGAAIYVFGTAMDGPTSFIANTIFSEEGALSGDTGGGVVFVTHSVVPKDLFPRQGFKDVGKNLIGAVELVDLGGGAWTLVGTSPAVGIADVTRIDPRAIDIRGEPLIQGSHASPGALAPA